MDDVRIATDRLLLREWRHGDADAMHAIGRDARVAEFLGPPMTLADARDFVTGQIVNQALFGHCFWPIERRFDAALIGYCGLNPAPKNTPLKGDVEIAWQLRHDAWGQGYAREAAEASLAWGWDNLDARRIAAMTVPANLRSRGLMERLGMRRVAGQDFDHPDVPRGNPLRRHIVYRIARPAG